MVLRDIMVGLEKKAKSVALVAGLAASFLFQGCVVTDSSGRTRDMQINDLPGEVIGKPLGRIFGAARDAAGYTPPTASARDTTTGYTPPTAIARDTTTGYTPPTAIARDTGKVSSNTPIPPSFTPSMPVSPATNSYVQPSLYYFFNKAEDVNGNGRIEFNAEELKGLRSTGNDGEVVTFTAREEISMLVYWSLFPFNELHQKECNLNNFYGALRIYDPISQRRIKRNGPTARDKIQEFHFSQGELPVGTYSVTIAPTKTDQNGVTTYLHSGETPTPKLNIIP